MSERDYAEPAVGGSKFLLDYAYSSGVIDEDFIAQTNGQLAEIDDERREQGVNPYVESERMMVRRSAVLAASIHRGQERDSGGDYFETHLCGTVNNIVSVCGRTGVVGVGASFLHDAPEDHGVRGEHITRMLLQGLDLSQPELKEVARVINSSAKRIGALVDSMHKIRKATKKETSIATAAKLLRSMRDIGLLALQVRFADRLHNISDLCGVEESKQERVARETDEIHVRLADIVDMQLIRNMLVERSAAILNPDLYFGFQELQMKRQNASLSAKLHEVFDDEARIKYKLVDFPMYTPMPLADFSVPLNRPISEIRLPHLGINSTTPVHEIEVIVEPGMDLRDVGHFISKNFAQKSDHPERKDLFDRGILLEIRSVRYGIIRFRINNRIAEARSKRGGCVEAMDDGCTMQVDESGSRVRRVITGIFKDAGKDDALVVQLAKERLLPPPITVFTPTNEPIMLHKGDRVADFAVKISSDFLLHFKGARELLKRGSKPLGFFDELEDGMTIELDAQDSSGEEPTPDIITLDPGLLLFVGRDAREALREKYLCKAEQPGYSFSVAVRGEKYISKIANLLGIEACEIMNAIKVAHPQFLQSYDDRILWHVGRGDIELLSTLNDTIFKKDEPGRQEKVAPASLEISIIVPDIPGNLTAFTKNLEPEQINLDNIRRLSKRQMKRLPTGTIGFKITISDASGKKSPIDMAKFLLKMSYLHSVRIHRSVN